MAPCQRRDGSEPSSQQRMLALVLSTLAALGFLLAAVGVGAAIAVSRLVESRLFAVNAREPAVYAAAASALVLVALASSLGPALRAARVDPVESLRAQ